MLLQINRLTKYFGGLLAVSDFNLELNTRRIGRCHRSKRGG